MPSRILSIFGMRPEAIKMAPLIKQLKASASIESVVCVTGQHQQMLDQVLDLFEIKPHHNFALMTGNQTLNGLTSRLIASLDGVLATVQPDRVLVHGDTTTASEAARGYANALVARLGKERVRIIAEAFRPAAGGAFRSATAAELAPQLLAYRGYRTYLFDGPHYVSDRLVQDLLDFQAARK